MKAEEDKAKFDADYSPDNPQNKKAAKDRDLKYDEKLQIYRGPDGAPVRDKFGQPL